MNTEWAWAAGLIEGEGCFTLPKYGVRLKISVHMTDLDVLQKLNSIMPGSIWKAPKQQEQHKESWVWCCCTDMSAHWTTKLYTYLGVRRKSKIDELLAVIQLRKRVRQKRENEVQDKRHQILRLREAGLSYSKIAKEVGVDRAYCMGVVKGKYRVVDVA